MLQMEGGGDAAAAHGHVADRTERSEIMVGVRTSTGSPKVVPHRSTDRHSLLSSYRKS